MTGRARFALAILSVAASLVTAEAAARVYYARARGLSLTARAPELLYAYYPELRSGAEPAQPGEARVLLLGASVLNQTFGTVAPELRAALAALWGVPVRVANLAMLGHSTLDSYYKYRALDGQRFDLVVVYHGINELRANNVPPDAWRDDYGHYAWYDEINFYFAHDRWRRGPFLLPFFLKHAAGELDRAVLHRRRYVPMHAPEPAWLAYGADVKSAPVFRRNLERILALAAERGDPILMMTFATHLPPNYSLERFLRHELGYGSGRGATPSPVELWGTPENVRAGLAVHDRILREVHAAHPEALFVDQQARLGDDPANFVDVCHLSPAGTRRFVDGIVAAVRASGLAPRRG